jgi:hypothetical protein
MANIISSSKAPSWKKFFQDNHSLDYSNKIIPQIRDLANIESTTSSIFETISKNPGIGLLCLDSDGENITMFHNPAIIGGSWSQSEQKLVAILGFHKKAVAIKIKESSIIGTKQKVPTIDKILKTIENKQPLKELKTKRLAEMFQYKNIIPVP